MKKINIFFALALLLGGFAACSDFLDRPAQGQMTKDDFLSNPDAATSLTNGIYEVYRVNDTWSAIGLWIPDLASDNALVGSQMSDGGGTIYTNGLRQYQNLSGLDGSSDMINFLWEQFYLGITRANNVLSARDEFPDMDERQWEVIEAEARFNRAWFYFQILRFWGKGPITPLGDLTGAEASNLDIAGSSELYDYIIEDLEFALNMPDKAESATWYETEWYGRAHKGSAQGLLAKVLLYRASDDPSNATAYYRRIVELVNEMDSSADGYDLIDLNRLWIKEGEYSAESVFEIGVESFTESNGSWQGWQAVGTRGDPNWGWGFIAPSLNLVRAYDDADQRKDWTIHYGETTLYSGMIQTPSVIDGVEIIGQVSATSATANGYPNRYIRKFYQPRPVIGGNENYGGNIRLMRWAEVLLIGAEAAAELGSAEAQEWMDRVRTRAGVPSVTATPENIWDEKRLEMAMEWDRYFDLVRIDKKNSGYLAGKFWSKVEDELDGLEWMQANHPDITPASTRLPLPPTNPVVVPKHYVFPVPNAQILLMNKLTQNQGY
ncbi:MAG: RagB/SusD family nutrient uptake outer membrane protein [Alistipes sp.]|nr:RagB/SusD family nutrient uptake outer membrane protein [Alistipes sp.]